MAVACSDSESTPIETLTQIESIDYTTSAYLSGEFLVADSEIFQLDGAKTTSLGSLPDAKSVGRIGADLWACGGSKDGFFVSKRTGDLWSTPTNLGSPRPEDTTFIGIGYTYDCRVTSEGFVFQHIEESDDGPEGWEYGAFATDSMLTEISDSSSRQSIIGWDNTIGHIALFSDTKIGTQHMGEAPILLSNEDVTVIGAAKRDNIAYVAYQAKFANQSISVARIENNTLGAPSSVNLDFSFLHELTISPMGNPILLGTRDDLPVLWTANKEFTFPQTVGHLSVHGNFVYLIDPGAEVLVFEFR